MGGQGHSRWMRVLEKDKEGWGTRMPGGKRTWRKDKDFQGTEDCWGEKDTWGKQDCLGGTRTVVRDKEDGCRGMRTVGKEKGDKTMMRTLRRAEKPGNEEIRRDKDI